MFIEYITLDHTRPCLAEPGKLIVVGKPSRAIDAALPLLNAILPNVTLAPHASAGVGYNPRSSALVLRRKPGFITLLADKIYITQVYVKLHPVIHPGSKDWRDAKRIATIT